MNTKMNEIQPEEMKGPLEHDAPFLQECYKPAVWVSQHKHGQSQSEPWNNKGLV